MAIMIYEENLLNFIILIYFKISLYENNGSKIDLLSLNWFLKKYVLDWKYINLTIILQKSWRRFLYHKYKISIGFKVILKMICLIILTWFS